MRIEGRRRPGERRGGRRVLREPGAREPDRRVGVASEPADGASRRLSSASARWRRASRAARCRGRRTGRDSGSCRARIEFWNNMPEPPARAPALHPARRRVAHRGPLPVVAAAEARSMARAVIFRAWRRRSRTPRRARSEQPAGPSTRRAPSTTSRAGAPASSTSTSAGTSSCAPTRSIPSAQLDLYELAQRPRGAGRRAAGAAALLRHPAARASKR